RLFDRHAHEELAHRHFHFLARKRDGDVVDAIDAIGYVPRRVLLAKTGVDLRRQRGIELKARRELHEQRHEELAARQIEIDDERVGDFRKRREHPIDFRGTDAYAEAIERRIRAPEDETAAARIDAKEIAVPPDAGVLLKVRSEIAAVLGV